MMSELKHTRKIRSFVRREGRMTASQKDALRELWPRYGINFESEKLDLNKLFNRDAPKILEIGFGMGHASFTMAQAHPNYDFVGIEVHRPGVGRLLKELHDHELSNVRVICDDAITLLKQGIPDASLAAVLLYFPDPWPKTRHHKRRIVNPDFLELIHKKLMPGGYFHVATDWQPYANAIRQITHPTNNS